MIACIDQPLSWLTLERHALAELPAAATARTTAHLAACAACRAALATIVGDARVMPPLPMVATGGHVGLPLPAPLPSAAPARRWWAPVGVVLAAAAVLLLVLLVRNPDEPRRGGGEGGGELARAVRVKGVGLVALTLVRDRDGVVAFDPPDVRDADRWKVQLSCAPGGATWVDLIVYQAGAPAGFPLAAHRLVCGNGVVVPGAFRITGGAATVCVRFGLDAATPPARASLPGAPTADLACARLVP